MFSFWMFFYENYLKIFICVRQKKNNLNLFALFWQSVPTIKCLVLINSSSGVPSVLYLLLNLLTTIAYDFDNQKKKSYHKFFHSLCSVRLDV